tara:strand:- start:3774 stop:4082 length:309 start_codon:yes stop_codon:yes gene_type:complete
MVEDIQILGLDDFDEDERAKIIDLTNMHYEKIKRDLPGKLVLHAKKHEKDGDRCKYSFHARIQIPNNLVNVNGEDWDLNTALNKALIKVENYTRNKFRTEGK